MLAAISTREELVNRLANNIAEFKATKSDEAYHKIEVDCLLIMSRKKTGDTPEGALRAMQEFDEVKSKLDLFNPNKQ